MQAIEESQTVPSAEWIERVKAAWPEIGPPLVNYLRTRLKSADQARDAAQEIYVRILNYKNPGEIRSLKLFTFTAAKRFATQLLIAGSRHRHLDAKFAIGQQLDTEHPSPEQVYADHGRLKALARALEELPPPVQIVWKAEVTGETAKEIAERLCMSLSTVYRYLIRAHQHLAKADGTYKHGERSNE